MNCKNNLRFYLLLFILFGSPLLYSGPTKNVNFDLLQSKTYGPQKSGKKTVVINNAQQFVDELQGFPVTFNHERVDFEKNTVVLISTGTQPTCDYDINVESVTDNGEEVTVVVTLETPKKDYFVTCGETYQYILLNIETKKTIRVKENAVKQNMGFYGSPLHGASP